MLFDRSGYVFGTDTWNEFSMFYYFAGFNSYLLLGHYIKQRNNWSVLKTFLIRTIMFAIGYYVTYTGYLLLYMVHESCLKRLRANIAKANTTHNPIPQIHNPSPLPSVLP